MSGVPARPVPGGAAPRIADKLSRLPRAPGVYVFYDAQGRPLYVGKAQMLRSRVRSYFGRTPDGRAFIPLMRRAAVDVDVMVTASEKEALILEHTLIKRHRPRYNVMLRDDKTYASVAVTLGEDYPRLVKIRRKRPPKSRVFGPYPSGAALNATLKVLRASAGIRTCSNADFRTRSRPCLEFDIGHCAAPCVGRQTRADYARGVEAVVAFLRGRTAPVLDRLRARMGAAAEAERFEEAARWRDRVTALERTAETQAMVDPEGGDRDVLGWHRDGTRVTVAVLQVREGTLVSTRRFALDSDLPDRELGAAVVGQLYTRDEPPPAEVLLPAKPEGAATLAEWLGERAGSRVRLWTPNRGKGRDLLRLAAGNASAESARMGARATARTRELLALAEAAGLPAPPAWIECIDVSHLGGQGTVAACVTFRDGEPVPRDYRHYRIARAGPGDDPAAVGEVVARRCARAAERGLPDLLLVDGGPAQLAAAVAARDAAGCADTLRLGALAKEAGDHGQGETAERLFLPGRAEPVAFPRGAPVLHLLQRIRDEAHRFAIAFQRRTRRAGLKSGLEGIPGLGPARRKALLARFGSLAGLRAAPEAAIRETPGLSAKSAEALLAVLRAPPGAGTP